MVARSNTFPLKEQNIQERSSHYFLSTCESPAKYDLQVETSLNLHNPLEDSCVYIKYRKEANVGRRYLSGSPILQTSST